MRVEQNSSEGFFKTASMTAKTIFQVVWLGGSAIIAYLFISYLLNSGSLSYNTIGEVVVLLLSPLGMAGLSVPTSPSAIPNGVSLFIMVAVVTLIMQIFVYIGFLFASPDGRRRTGDPHVNPTQHNPYDDPYG